MMKKLLSAMIAGALLVGSLASCGGNAADTTASLTDATGSDTTQPAETTGEEDKSVTIFGKSEYSIIYNEEGRAAEVNAAEQLAKYLKLITGRDFPLLSDKTATTDCEIVVGKTSREGTCFELDREALTEDELRVFTSGKRLVLLGGGTRGTLYAVFDFLEMLGCGFYATDCEKVPTLNEIKLPEDLNVDETPAFEYRDIFQTCTYDMETAVKLRLNGGLLVGNTVGRKITAKWGGAITYAGESFVHTFNQFVPVTVYAKTHPEYFSLINGERNTTPLYTQLCLTNEDVYQLVLSGVKNWLSTNKSAGIISVSQYDSYVIDCYCTCENCKAINDYEGSAAGTLLHFVNRIADDIKEDYPDVVVSTLAYQHTVTPCKHEVPRDNVSIEYCTGMCCAHGVSDDHPTCNNTKIAAANIENWAKVCDRIYIWDYTVNFAHYLCPFPNLYSVAESIKFYSEHNVKGVFMQGMYQDNSDSKSGEFGELRAYLMAKLMWDPTLDPDELINDFIKNYYSESAADYIRAYLDKIHTDLDESGKCWYIVDPADLFNGILDDDEIASLDAMWESAKAATVDTVYYDRVRRSEIQWRYYKYCAKKLEFATSRTKKAKQLWTDCKELGITHLSEGALIP